MTYLKISAIVAASVFLTACEGGGLGALSRVDGDKTTDFGTDKKDLSQLQAGIWVDPNGCDHWIIDDGVEGYLSQRLDKFGKPVCSGAGAPGTANGGFKSGSNVRDPF